MLSARYPLLKVSRVINRPGATSTARAAVSGGSRSSIVGGQTIYFKIHFITDCTTRF